MNIELVELSSFQDERGLLVAIEALKDIPFNISRIYYFLNTELSSVRGFHAHKKLEQLIVVLKGKCTFTLDNGSDRKSVQLDSPTQGLLLKSGIWREIDEISHDCICLVIASEFYDESDYIRDYDDFKEYISKIQ